MGHQTCTAHTSVSVLHQGQFNQPIQAVQLKRYISKAKNLLNFIFYISEKILPLNGACHCYCSLLRCLKRWEIEHEWLRLGTCSALTRCPTSYLWSVLLQYSRTESIALTDARAFLFWNIHVQSESREYSCFAHIYECTVYLLFTRICFTCKFVVAYPCGRVQIRKTCCGCKCTKG